MKIDTPLSRLYNVAEFFFGDGVTSHLDLVNSVIDQEYSSAEDADVKEAFKRYLDFEDPLYFSTGICETLTAGFGHCNDYGYFEFPLPAKFINLFLVTNQPSKEV